MATNMNPPGGLFSGAQRMPGLLQSRWDRLSGGLGRLAGGADDPRLTAEQNEQARRQAQLQAGLAMLASPGRGIAGIAEGLMYGQQAGIQGREQIATTQAAEMQKRERMARLQQAAGTGQIDRAALERLFVAAITSGDTEAAGDLSEVLKSMGGNQGPVAPVRGSPEWLAAREAELALEAKYAPPRPPTPGTPEYTAMLRERAQIAAEFRPAPRTAAGSEGERKAAAFAGMVEDGTNYIDTVVNAPSRIEQVLSNRNIGEFTDDEQQQLSLAGNALAEAWLRMTTGAAYNEREFDNAYNLFVPRPGDKKAALDWKRNNRRRLQEMIRTHSGRLAPEPQEAPADFDPFGDL